MKAGANEKQLEVTFKSPCWRGHSAASSLIARTHYQRGRISGEFIVGYAQVGRLREIKPRFRPAWCCGELCLVGAAVIAPGCAYSNPKGRRDLAAAHFPRLSLDTITRDAIVRAMGLAMITRIAPNQTRTMGGAGTDLPTRMGALSHRNV